MPLKEINLTITLPRHIWQCLAAMAAQDVREHENFVHWLIIKEARRRSLLPADTETEQTVIQHNNETS